MKKPFCDNCGKEINPSIQGITMVEIKTAFTVNEKTNWTSARDSNLDFCDAFCFGRGMEKWMERQMKLYRELNTYV